MSETGWDRYLRMRVPSSLRVGKKTHLKVWVGQGVGAGNKKLACTYLAVIPTSHYIKKLKVKKKKNQKLEIKLGKLSLRAL